MLPQVYRLSRHADIQLVLRSGRRSYGSLLSVSAIPNKLDRSRFAVIVGKKQYLLASDRNRAKRLIRESIRTILPNISPGFDITVLLIRKADKRLEISILISEIENLIQKLCLLQTRK